MNLKLVVPAGVIGVSLLGAVGLVATSEPVAGTPSEVRARPVRVLEVRSERVELTVRSQGTVAPRTESSLIPEVSGPVVWTSPALVSGGYFEVGDTLLRIDARDYEAAVERARNGLVRAEAELAYAKQTLERQQGLANRSVASPSALEGALRAERVAAATAGDARVAFEEAQRNLERTEIVAPFTGRVREESVDVGQFLNRGTPFATLYATDYLEVRLPISDHQLAYIDLPLGPPGKAPDSSLPEVRLTARFAGADRTWTGHIVRTEGEIDPKSRMVHVVARVEEPARVIGDGGIPLTLGLFVQAEIQGRAAEEVIVLPRSAIVGEDRVLVVDDEDRLRFRQVDILRIQRDDVLVRGGLVNRERVMVSQLQTPVDGMRVEPVPVEPAGAQPVEGGNTGAVEQESASPMERGDTGT